MPQDIIVSILVYLCIFQNPNATSLSLEDGVKKQESSLSSECQNCGKIEKKVRREFGGIPTRDAKSKYKNPSEYLHEYKYPRMSNSINYLLLKGWGARGMPFNVLYTPNTHQQKIMKYIPHKQEKEKPGKEQERNIPLIYNLVLEDEKSSRTRENTLKKHMVPRKYYSLIPQLFVSYGCHRLFPSCDLLLNTAGKPTIYGNLESANSGLIPTNGWFKEWNYKKN